MVTEISRLRDIAKDGQFISPYREKEIEDIKQKILKLDEAYKNQFEIFKTRIVEL